MVVRIALVLCVLVFGALVPVLEINDTHVFNPTWPGHARLHQVWQLATNMLLALVCIVLAVRGRHLRLAALVAFCVTSGFVVAYVIRASYGGSMPGEGESAIGAGLRFVPIVVMGAVSLVLAYLALTARERIPSELR